MKHFTFEELTKSAVAQSEGIDNTPTAAVMEQLAELVENVLDPLREAWGAPVTVTSGYRCPALNEAVGGVKNSQHIAGQAADITAGGTDANRRLMKVLRGLNLLVDQAIAERGYRWLHVSHGPRNRRSYMELN